LTTKVWFITGTSRGLGREWAIAALKRGDKVAAAARDTSSLDGLVTDYGDAVLPIQLDVTDRTSGFSAIERAYDHFGRLDVVVNNAGYAQFGFIEEISEKEARNQFDTNVFGTLWITQAALPYLRAQRSGHIVQVSSLTGIIAYPNIGMYSASKAAIEGFSEALAQEVSSFGIHVTLIEPAGFATDPTGKSTKQAAQLADYRELHEEADRVRSSFTTQAGDPTATAGALLKVVDADNPPLRVFFGAVALQVARGEYERRLKTWDEWQPVAIEAQG
jgi:NAD(P)-dependent dehydrogenase (short-subunit alcohol dehydrogenase family)